MNRNKEPEKIVPYDSSEAASIQTVTGWVSRSGRFWGNDEQMERFGVVSPMDSSGSRKVLMAQ